MSKTLAEAVAGEGGEDVFSEESRLLVERSSRSTETSAGEMMVAINAVITSLGKSYPDLTGAEARGIAHRCIGVAMREARGLQDKRAP